MQVRQNECLNFELCRTPSTLQYKAEVLGSTFMNALTDVLAESPSPPRTRRRILQNIGHAPRVFYCIGLALWSFVHCLPILAAMRPKTPLRVLCIAAFEYLSRLEGRSQKPSTRAALAFACDFGALRNDFYDQKELNRSEYRTLRLALRRLVPDRLTRRYMHNLRQAERSRPLLRVDPGFESSAVEYRNRVLVLSMDWLHGIACVRWNAALFQSLVALTGLIQLVDDLLDWEDDWKHRRPSYITAVLNRSAKASPDIYRCVHLRANHFRDILLTTSNEHPEAAPVAMAGIAVWALAVALARIRFIA